MTECRGITRANVDPDLSRHMAILGHNDLMHYLMISIHVYIILYTVRGNTKTLVKNLTSNSESFEMQLQTNIFNSYYNNPI